MQVLRVCRFSTFALPPAFPPCSCPLAFQRQVRRLTSRMSSESYPGYPECVVSCHGADRFANSIPTDCKTRDPLLLICQTVGIYEPVSKTHLINHRFSLEKLVSFGDRKESAEAASLLPQASALLPGAEFVAGCGRRRWGSGTLLQPPEDLGSTFLVQIHTDQLASVIVQRPVAPTVLPYGHTVSPLEVGQSVCPCP